MSDTKDRPHIRIEIGQTVGEPNQNCRVTIGGIEVPAREVEVNADVDSLTTAKITVFPDEVVKAGASRDRSREFADKIADKVSEEGE